MRRCLTLGVLVAAACQATTTRPPFVPMPEAEHGEIGLGQANKDSSVIRVTRVLAEALRKDSVPVRTVREFDGYLDSGWFDATTLEPTSHRPLGPDVVRVRAWVDPAKPGYNRINIETVYVPVADPSRTPRELEAPAPADHPVTKRVAALMTDLVKKYGDPADQKITPAPGGPPLKGGKGAKPDSTGKKVPLKGGPVRPDSLAKRAPGPDSLAKKAAADSAARTLPAVDSLAKKIPSVDSAAKKSPAADSIAKKVPRPNAAVKRSPPADSLAKRVPAADSAAKRSPASDSLRNRPAPVPRDSTAKPDSTARPDSTVKRDSTARS